MLKEIKTKEDMILWAKIINESPLSTAARCDFQDIWGHSNADLLKKLFIECEADRALIVCSLHNIMSYDTVQEMLFHLARTKAQKIVDEEIEHYNNELTKKEKDLAERKASFTNCLKGYWKRIKDLRNEVARVNEDKERAYDIGIQLRRENADLRKEMQQYKKDAENFRTIKGLLQ